MSEPENSTVAEGATADTAEGDTILPGDGTRTTDHAVSTAGAPSLEELEGPRLLASYQPAVGDYCVVDGEVARIEVYDPAANIFTALVQNGNSVNRVTNHITTARFEQLHEDGTHRLTTDGLDFAASQASWVSNPGQETVDEGLTRTLARQGDQFTSAVQQGYIANQPHAGDSPELVRAKVDGDADRVAELTPTDASTAGRADTAPEDAALPGTEVDSSVDSGVAE